MGATIIKPQHQHDCDACNFMGRFTDDSVSPAREVDLYYCPSYNSLVARFGRDGEYYSSHPDFAVPGPPALAEALTRARKAGYLT